MIYEACIPMNHLSYGFMEHNIDVCRCWTTLRKRVYWMSKEKALDHTTWRTCLEGAMDLS